MTVSTAVEHAAVVLGEPDATPWIGVAAGRIESGWITAAQALGYLDVVSELPTVDELVAMINTAPEGWQ